MNSYIIYIIFHFRELDDEISFMLEEEVKARSDTRIIRKTEDLQNTDSKNILLPIICVFHAHFRRRSPRTILTPRSATCLFSFLVR